MPRKSVFMKWIFCLVICLAFIPIMNKSSANVSIVAVSANDQILDIRNGSMPRFINGQVYVPHTVFNYVGVRTSYNASEEILTMYNFKRTLIFELDTGVVNDEAMNKHSPSARMIGGIIFVPIDLVSSHFGLHYSYISWDIPIIRLTNYEVTLSDTMFANIAEPRINEELEEYYKLNNHSGSGSGTVIPTPPPDEDEDEDEIDETYAENVYFTFDGISAEQTSAVLDLMKNFGIKGNFFVTKDEVLENEELIRRMIGEGHAVGALISDIDDFYAEITEINSALYDVAIYKTRIIRVLGGSQGKITDEILQNVNDAGYRLWDYTITEKPVENLVFRDTRELIDIDNADIVLKFLEADDYLELLEQNIEYCRENGVKMSKIYLSTTPLSFYDN